MNGATVSFIDPSHIGINTLPPPVHIEQITADGTAFEARPGLRLPPLVRNLRIDYTALGLVVPEKNQFRVMLEGPRYRLAGRRQRRQAFYTDLAPGSYRFRVRGSNNSGVWNEAGAMLEFSIAPAYYQTRWFAALVVAGVFGAPVGWLSRPRSPGRAPVRAAARRTSQRAHSHCPRAARHAASELPRSAAAIPDRVVPAAGSPGRGERETRWAIDHAAKAITEGRDAVQGLRASTIEKNNLALAIRALGDELAADASADQPPTFTCRSRRRDARAPSDSFVTRSTRLLRKHFGMPSGTRMPDGSRSRSATTHEQFRLRVRDDGKGIDPKVLANQGLEGHYGLRGMPERAALIGGKLAVWSEVGAGTEVELRLPARIVYATSRRRSWLSRLLASKTPAHVEGDAS